MLTDFKTIYIYILLKMEILCVVCSSEGCRRH